MTTDDVASAFEAQRPRLHAVAFRLLGSEAEADDAVQEAWLRLARADADAIDNLPGWLTTVVARIALDLLKARDRRREDSFDAGLPEPVVTAAPGPDPEHEALLADSIGLALLVVLDTLPPRDRLAFVLHDMFSVPFRDIAPIVGTTPDAVRQMASRARRRVRGAPGSGDDHFDPAHQRELVDAFLRAARDGDFERLLTVLDPGVVFRHDRGGRRALDVLVGADDVARQALDRGRPFLHRARPATVNGGPGVVVVAGDRVVAVAAIAVAGDRIAGIDLVTAPAKLRSVHAPGPADGDRP
jgi:RNA polymerase sigma factor (sigma-70 family)